MTTPRRLTALLAAGLLAACHQRTQEQEEMQTHFQRVGEIHTAVMLGNIDQARAAARWIAEHQELGSLPAIGAIYVNEMKQQAARVAGSTDIHEASIATARMGRMCGACHHAVGRGPRFRPPGPPPGGAVGVGPSMTRHRWAADRMWEGLIGPSDTSWAAGALALSDAPLYIAEAAVRTGRAVEIEEMARASHDLARRAQLTTAPDSRADIYGDWLGDCERCHSLVRTTAPAPR